MNKLSTKPTSKITYLPNETLTIEIELSSLKQDFYFDRIFRFVVLPILLIFYILILLGYINKIYSSIISLIFYVFYFSFLFLRKDILKSITFTPTTMALNYWNKKSKKEMRVGYESLYFEVKILSDKVALRIENQTIMLENVADFPMVIDHISTLWDFEYYDTFHTGRNSEILIYKPKTAVRFEPKSFLYFEETVDTIKFLDKMDITTYFEVDKSTGLMTNFKFNKTFLQSRKQKRIEILVMSESYFGNSGKRIILKVAVIYENGESQYIFKSDKRPMEDELTVLRDMEMIYEQLRKIKALDNVEIEKII